METMKAKIDALKTQLASSLTKDSTPEQIKEVEGYKKSLDEIEQKYDEVVKEKQEVTELYIQSQKNQGSKDLTDDADKEKQPRSLEEIAQDILDKDSKK